MRPIRWDARRQEEPTSKKNELKMVHEPRRGEPWVLRVGRSSRALPARHSSGAHPAPHMKREREVANGLAARRLRIVHAGTPIEHFGKVVAVLGRHHVHGQPQRVALMTKRVPVRPRRFHHDDRLAQQGACRRAFPRSSRARARRGCVLRLGGCSLLLASAGGLLVRVRHESGCGGLCARETGLTARVMA